MSSRFSDAQVVVILKKAARRINRKLWLTGTSEEIVVDTSTGEITPNNEDLKDLVLMQAECMIAQREASEELNEGNAGVLVKDGEQRVDTRGVGLARGTFFDSPHGVCSELKSCLIEAQLERNGNNGKMIW